MKQDLVLVFLLYMSEFDKKENWNIKRDSLLFSIVTFWHKKVVSFYALTKDTSLNNLPENGGWWRWAPTATIG